MEGLAGIAFATTSVKAARSVNKVQVDDQPASIRPMDVHLI